MRMEVQTVNNTSLLKNSLLSSTSSSLTSATAKESQLSVSASTGSGSSATSSVSGSTSTSTGSGSSAAPSAAAAVAAPHLNNTTTANTANTAITASKTHHSLSISPASSNSEIEKELHDLELNIALNRDAPHSLGDDLKCQSNDSLSGASSVSATGLHCTGNGHVNGNASVANLVGGSDGGDSGVGVSSTHTIVPAAAVVNGNGTAVSNGTANSANSANSATISAQVKKRISSSRTPTRKARRIKFYRNGDRFYPGITIPVSNERYRSFESLFEDVTRLLEENVKIPGAVRTIFTMCGKKICTLDELEDGQSYVCSCNNETFKKIEYNTTSQPLANLTLSNKASNRLSKVLRPSSPLKNGSIGGSGGGGGSSVGGGNISIAGTNGSPITVQLHVVFPRIVTLIRNGTKPRKIMRLLLNKRNSPTFDHVLTAITQVVRLDTYVRKVFTLSGSPVLQLADFFGPDDVFFAYGTERVNYPDDFKLEAEEQKAIQAIRKTLRTAGTTCTGPKPKMPGKSKNIHSVPTNLDHSNSLTIEEVATSSASAGGMINDSGIDMDDLPVPIRERYILGQIIGDGNFAIVLKMKDRQTGLPCALKIIDKSKCKGKEHYIDAEVRVMKKLQHPHIISLIMDVDQLENMFLVLEYVSGGDLFDAITRVTRFSEDQSRVMIRHLASAMAYLHSMCIVHRDIKPENLLVELDGKGNVIELKLADFGLACEVTEPLYAVCGTPTYVAPEILMETGYELKIDVWAAGIILYILLCGFPPFVAPDNEQEPLFDAIIKGVYEFPDPYWSDIGDGVRDLIANMLQSDPKVRFSSEDILDHYWTMGDGDYNDYSS